jgi:hypothetical protein
MGVWSASARLTLGPTSLVFAVVPFFTPSRLPLTRSRWTPPVPSTFMAVADDPVQPDQDLGATQYRPPAHDGSRLGRIGQLLRWLRSQALEEWVESVRLPRPWIERQEAEPRDLPRRPRAGRER